jgi:hypothetical protein
VSGHTALLFAWRGLRCGRFTKPSRRARAENADDVIKRHPGKSSRSIPTRHADFEDG